MSNINIVGPSHVVRLENAHKLGSLKLPSGVAFIGKGGMPIWHDTIDQLQVDLLSKYLVVVGDFRFGNGYLDLGLKSNITGISKESIKKSIDVECYQRTMKSLAKYEKEWNVSSTFLFWDLAMREAKNIVRKNYCDANGCYKHPIWNLKEVEDSFKNTFSLAGLSPEQLISMCIDDSNHPSFLGYVFLSKLIYSIYLDRQDISSSELYKKSCDYVYAIYKREKPISNIFGKTILHRYLKLSQSFGVISDGVNAPINIDKLPNMLKQHSGASVYISNIRYHDDFPRFCKDIDSIKEVIKECNHGQVKIIFWDIFARCVFESRQGKNIGSLYIQIYKLLLSNFSRYMLELPFPDTSESLSLVELNKAGQPTYKMLCYLVDNSNSYDSFSNDFKKKIELMVEE